MRLEIIVCDICQDPSRDAQHFSISVDDDTISVDLCHQHSKPITDTLAEASQAVQEPQKAPAKQSHTNTKKTSQRSTQKRTQRNTQAPAAQFSAPEPKRATRRRAGGLAVTSIEDIEKSKQE